MGVGDGFGTSTSINSVGSLWFDGLSFTPPIQKSLVAELMLPTECGSTESGLIKLREPVFALLLGESSRRHAGQNTSIETLGEIIHIGPLGRLLSMS